MAALGKIMFLLRRRFATAETRHLKNSQHIHVANPWHAVGIVGVRPGCPACGRYKNVRFLAKEAPPLPLKGCPIPKAASVSISISRIGGRARGALSSVGRS